MEGPKMSHDVQTLRQWLFVVVVIAGVGATSVPFLYSFTGWRKSRLGKLFMFKSLAFATLVDLFVLFKFWHPNIYVIVLFYAVVFTAVATFSIGLSIYIFRVNYLVRRDLDEK
jgi:hypothetical protein